MLLLLRQPITQDTHAASAWQPFETIRLQQVVLKVWIPTTYFQFACKRWGEKV
jgi:hypothetical protein